MVLGARGKFLFERPVFRADSASGRFGLRVGSGGGGPAGVPLHGRPRGGFGRRHRRQGGEHLAQIVGRVDLLFAAGLYEAVEDGCALPGVARAEEEPVLFLMRSSA
jgi:hypothetical protein